MRPGNGFEMISTRLAGRIVVAFVVLGFVALGAAPLFAQPRREPGVRPSVWEQPQQPNDFVPLKDLPGKVQQEQLPAAPLVMGAYGFVWVALLVYVWSLWRRVGAVQRELTDLRQRAERKAS